MLKLPIQDFSLSVNKAQIRRLEFYSSSELHDARAADGIGNLAKVRASEFAVGSGEIGGVENIENVPTDFK
jgi:hypothetical protein